MRFAQDKLDKYIRGDLPKTEEARTAAKEILLNTESTATAVFLATRLLTGSDGFIAWEPESIWLELMDNGVDLPEVNRDKLMAYIILGQGDSFYWDAQFFENAVIAFNNLPVEVSAIQDADANELCWGVFEAELATQAFHKHSIEFDYEPQRYIANSLCHAGFIVAPELLAMTQDELDELNRGNKECKAEVISKWQTLANTDFSTEENGDETPVGVQLKRLAAAQFYTHARAKQLRDELARL